MYSIVAFSTTRTHHHDHRVDAFCRELAQAGIATRALLGAQVEFAIAQGDIANAAAV